MSHDYFHTMAYARRIQSSLPGIRLIACLREPGSQTRSAYGWWRTHGGFQGSYEEFVVSDLGYQPVNYYENLKNYFEFFPRDSIFVTFFDTLQHDPRDFIRDIYQFLNVDPEFIPPNIEHPSNAFAKPRSPLVTSLAYTTGQVVRRVGLGNVVGWVKHNPFTRGLLYAPASRETVTTADHQALAKLRARCRTWYPALEDLLQQPLPQHWYEQ